MPRRPRDPEPSPKAEALKAVRHVAEQLLDGQPSTPLDRKLMLATLDHAAEQIERITELKRARRVKGATT